LISENDERKDKTWQTANPFGQPVVTGVFPQTFLRTVPDYSFHAFLVTCVPDIRSNLRFVGCKGTEVS
jgi:hypothetical protein